MDIRRAALTAVIEFAPHDAARALASARSSHDHARAGICKVSTLTL